MIGAFAAAIIAGLTGSFWLALLASLAAAAMAGVLIEILIIRRLYRRDHLDQVLATFALILLLSEGVRWSFGAFPLYLNIPNSLGGSVLLPFEIIYSKYRMFIILVGISIAIGLYFLISKTRLGIRIRAGQNDRQMISALGVDISKLYTIVFAIGAALAGLAGAMIGAIQSVEVGMGEPILILAFVVIVIGGIGSIKGAFIGSILVGVTDTIGRVFLPNLLKIFMDTSNATSMGSSIGSMLIYILMALILIIKPSGLFGINEK
jgi:branched-chain amino acid transport system permease protein